MPNPNRIDEVLDRFKAYWQTYYSHASFAQVMNMLLVNNEHFRQSNGNTNWKQKTDIEFINEIDRQLGR
jgi:hypothetical protein